MKFKNEPVKTTQAQSQQAAQPGHKLNNCLYNNQTSVPENKPEEKVLQDVVNNPNPQSPTPYAQEWNSPEVITDVAGMLGCCDSPEMLHELRECDIPVPVLKLAARQLTADKRNQIREWVMASSA